MELEKLPPSRKNGVPLEIPELTPEEQAEREKALERMLRRRAEMPPLEVSTAELVRQARRRETEDSGG